MSSAPVIGITTGRGEANGNPTMRVGEAYVEAVLKAGGVPVLLPVSRLPAETVLTHINGLLFTGGGDIDPLRFNGVNHPKVYGIDPLRDEMEIALVQAAAGSGLPFLAICRGIQVVNVALGGTLYTDIRDQLPGALHHEHVAGMPRDRLTHPVQVAAGSRLAELLGSTQVMVNSLHHQGVQQLAARLRPVAAAPDGLVEAVELGDHPFGLAVQWHPEALPRLEAMQALFRELVKVSSSKMA